MLSDPRYSSRMYYADHTAHLGYHWDAIYPGETVVMKYFGNLNESDVEECFNDTNRVVMTQPTFMLSSTRALVAVQLNFNESAEYC